MVFSLYFVIGTICMFILGLIRKHIYELKVIKIAVMTILLLIFGVSGTMILFYIENGRWGGTSFYGSLFFIPVFFAMLVKLLKITYGKIMDFCAPAICIMLVVMKWRCWLDGCCAGRILFHSENGTGIRFPSQWAEIIVITLIMIMLIVFEKRGMFANRRYAILLIAYGGTRFVLNSFRADLSSFIWILPPGHFWSIISVLIGSLTFYLIGKSVNKEGDTKCEK